MRGLMRLCLKAHNLGRDAIERLFFGEVDTKGAAIRDILVERGAEGLTGDQRCDFARLLLSLDARRPCNINKLRTDIAGSFETDLDADSEIRAAMAERGIDDIPSNYVKNQLGWSLEDRALTIIQRLVDNPHVGGRLINANWAVKRLAPRDGSLVLSDRPLIRIYGYDSPGATWVLPLTPHTAFIAANHEENLRRLLRLTGQRFAKAINVSSAKQADKFVFSIEESHERWIRNYLSQNQHEPR
ncbi:hypothetical protein HQ394_02050 [Defluviicoccus vanus]|uniref:DUF4238 domain-containing protein n=1 Tax=Defluviicoccus vanus TaxID=111831 RepID=A0A7H1MY24_9PROT|nr:hypothetical protein HQ394_02050 [Defluviicoccus vanus]